MAYTLGLDEVCIETCTRPTPCTTYMCEHADRRTYIDIHITYIQKCVHAWINTEQRTCRQTERDRETERHHRDRQTDGRTCETADLQTYVHTCMYNHANIQKGTHTHAKRARRDTDTSLHLRFSASSIRRRILRVGGWISVSFVFAWTPRCQSCLDQHTPAHSTLSQHSQHLSSPVGTEPSSEKLMSLQGSKAR